MIMQMKMERIILNYSNVYIIALLGNLNSMSSIIASLVTGKNICR